MSDKRTLLDAVQGVSGKAAPPPHTEGPVTYVAPSRRMLKPKTFHLDPAAVKQLKSIALDLDRSEQDCLREALNDWFVKHGKPELA